MTTVSLNLTTSQLAMVTFFCPKRLAANLATSPGVFGDFSGNLKTNMKACLVPHQFLSSSCAVEVIPTGCRQNSWWWRREKEDSGRANWPWKQTNQAGQRWKDQSRRTKGQKNGRKPHVVKNKVAEEWVSEELWLIAVDGLQVCWWTEWEQVWCE